MKTYDWVQNFKLSGFRAEELHTCNPKYQHLYGFCLTKLWLLGLTGRVDLQAN